MRELTPNFSDQEQNTNSANVTMGIKFLENKGFLENILYSTVLSAHALQHFIPYSKYFPPGSNFKFIAVEAPAIGSVILTPAQTWGINIEKP